MTKELRLATILTLSTAVISGLSNFIAKIGVTAIKDPIVFTTLKNGIVAILLIGILIALSKRVEIKAITRRQWLKLLSIGFVGGFVPFALFFTGLAKTSALNASLIHKTLFIWVILFGVYFLKEKVSKGMLLGAGLIFSANLVIGGFKGFNFNSAELMIITATLFWAIENVVAKNVLEELSPSIVVSARMVFGSLMLLGLVTWQGNLDLVSNMNSTMWLWTGISSLLLLGYVTTWYAALKHAPASYVATLLVPATLVTNTLSAIFITHSLNYLIIVNGILYVIGTAVFIYFAKSKTEHQLQLNN